MSFISLEPEDRREVIRTLGADYNVLIETGTNQGLTPMALVQSFKEIYTIELEASLYEAARRKLSSYPNIHCLHGDSTLVLPNVLDLIREPAVVWLDGHYSGPGTAHGVFSTPIREELQILFKDGRPHLILIDDARIFDGGPEHELYEHYYEYPTLLWVQEVAESYGYSYELKDDIIRLTP